MGLQLGLFTVNARRSFTGQLAVNFKFFTIFLKKFVNFDNFPQFFLDSQAYLLGMFRDSKNPRPGNRDRDRELDPRTDPGSETQKTREIRDRLRFRDREFKKKFFRQINLLKSTIL